MSDLSPESRAIRAADLLANETFQDALAAIEASAVDALADADVADPASLIRHTAALQAARALRQHVESIVTNAAPAPPAPTFA